MSDTAKLTPTQAQSELARLGYVPCPDLEPLGAEMRQGQWVFHFRLGQTDKVISAVRDSLPCLLAKSAWINRPEPLFDLAQKSLTDPQAWRELQRLRREDYPEYYRLTHPEPKHE